MLRNGLPVGRRYGPPASPRRPAVVETSAKDERENLVVAAHALVHPIGLQVPIVDAPADVAQQSKLSPTQPVGNRLKVCTWTGIQHVGKSRSIRGIELTGNLPV